METVWGKKGRSPLLFGGIGEMMRNTCDHAFKQQEDITWHLGVSHFEETKTVKFCFIDNGEGIISTYSKKNVWQQIINYFQNNAEMLYSAFKNGIQSRTGLKWRGKGLPTIYEMYTDGIITNLKVITNDVLLDFDQDISMPLKIPFKGTCYFWQVNDKCSKSCFPL